MKSISKLPIAVGAYDYFTEEADREVTSTKCTSSTQHHDHFTDPLDKLLSMSPDLTTLIVDHLVKSLAVVQEEANLIQEMTIGQRDNPLWMDARQFRLTASYFGRVCRTTVDYPPSLLKQILGDYGNPTSPSLQWGREHETKGIEAYCQIKEAVVQQCGVFISTSHPFLAASPDENS